MAQPYTKHDRDLADKYDMYLKLAGGDFIIFQFPPKIKNDSRGGDWKEDTTGPNAGDPIATYQHGTPREISIEWKYVVDGSFWNVATIQRQLTKMRRYFVNNGTDKKPSLFGNLVVLIKLWGMGGPKEMSYRFKSISIKHGDTIVGSGMNAFALETDVSAELRSWPKILNVQWSKSMLVTPKEWY